MKVSTILDSIDNGAIALPEFQRGYVWNRNQVRSLMDSLYRGHPVGGLLMWQTRTEGAPARGDAPALQPGTVELLLDGQQRMTTLYGLIRGNPPPFFDGNDRAFADLRFHLEEEVFEFFQPVRMGDDPLWIDVSDLMHRGAGEVIGEMIQHAADDPNLMSRTTTWIERLNRIDQVKEREFHVDKVTGEEMTIDVVVEIFNRVNSGGTKLSKGDLALAKVCAGWTEARVELKSRLAGWEGAGFDFSLEWLLRCINAVVTGRAYFPYLVDRPAADIRGGLDASERAVDKLLNAISSRLGLDHARVLQGVYAFPVMVRYLADRDFRFPDHRERDRLLCWYLHSAMWGRFAASTETVLAQDLAAITASGEGDPIEGLMENLRGQRGDVTVRPNSFQAATRGARFYPVLYALTRVGGAKDWETGDRLDQHALGRGTDLHLHHIFPKKVLYDAGFDKSQVNSLANLTFLTQETNISQSDRHPREYLPGYVERDPHVIESHWIPLDPALWETDRYEDFLARRQELLATATNELLERLWSGLEPEREPDAWEDEETTPLEVATADDESAVLIELQGWLSQQGLDEGELDHELVSADGAQEATLDLAWPEGIQLELTEPVALLIDEPQAVVDAATRHGFRVFTEVESLKTYVTSLVEHELVVGTA